jgi:hypothetical protein
MHDHNDNQISNSFRHFLERKNIDPDELIRKGRQTLKLNNRELQEKIEEWKYRHTHIILPL